MTADTRPLLAEENNENEAEPVAEEAKKTQVEAQLSSPSPVPTSNDDSVISRLSLPLSEREMTPLPISAAVVTVKMLESPRSVVFASSRSTSPPAENQHSTINNRFSCSPKVNRTYVDASSVGPILQSQVSKVRFGPNHLVLSNGAHLTGQFDLGIPGALPSIYTQMQYLK